MSLVLSPQSQEGECEGFAGEQACENPGIEKTERNKMKFGFDLKDKATIQSFEKSMQYELT